METLTIEKKEAQPNTPEVSLYEQDFYKWALHNAELLRQGKITEADIENIAEELDSMSRRDRKELANRLAILIMHLLKLQYQPEKQRHSKSWVITVGNQRAAIKRSLKESPSLKYNIVNVIDEEFKTAKKLFEKETGMSKKTLPEECPYTFEQLMDYDFLPGE